MEADGRVCAAERAAVELRIIRAETIDVDGTVRTVDGDQLVRVLDYRAVEFGALLRDGGETVLREVDRHHLTLQRGCRVVPKDLQRLGHQIIAAVPVRRCKLGLHIRMGGAVAATAAYHKIGDIVDQHLACSAAAAAPCQQIVIRGRIAVVHSSTSIEDTASIAPLLSVNRDTAGGKCRCACWKLDCTTQGDGV